MLEVGINWILIGVLQKVALKELEHRKLG